MLTLKNKKIILFIWIGLFLFISAANTQKSTPLKFEIPNNWPKPNYNFKNNPLTEEGLKLGRKLFYDPILSKDNSISCSSCHLSFTAFTHIDHDLSHGIYDSIGNRNSLALSNLAWNKSFMWDGAINHLDMQALAPINHPLEMGESTENVIQKLQASRDYPVLFYDAFGDSTITGEYLLKSLSQFQITLISANSKYDQVINKIPGIEFTEQEKNGYSLFKKNCESCHKEPLFTNGELLNNGLKLDSILLDFGRMGITKSPKDSLKFKVPTLRNIEFSKPYMHDGRFEKLSQVLNHYTAEVQHSQTLAPELKKQIKLSKNEKIDLLAFLYTLTDKEFLFNQKHSFPRN